MQTGGGQSRARRDGPQRRFRIAACVECFDRLSIPSAVEGLRRDDFGLKFRYQRRGLGRTPRESLCATKVMARLDTFERFNIDWREFRVCSTVAVAEDRDLEKAPAKDGGCGPSFAGLLHLQGGSGRARRRAPKGGTR